MGQALQVLIDTRADITGEPTAVATSYYGAHNPGYYGGYYPGYYGGYYRRY